MNPEESREAQNDVFSRTGFTLEGLSNPSYSDFVANSIRLAKESGKQYAMTELHYQTGENQINFHVSHVRHRRAAEESIRQYLREIGLPYEFSHGSNLVNGEDILSPLTDNWYRFTVWV